MEKNLAKIAAPDSSYFKINRGKNPEYVEQRIKLIRNQPGWWLSLDRYQPGFDILDIAMDLEF